MRLLGSLKLFKCSLDILGCCGGKAVTCQHRTQLLRVFFGGQYNQNILFDNVPSHKAPPLSYSDHIVRIAQSYNTFRFNSISTMMQPFFRLVESRCLSQNDHPKLLRECRFYGHESHILSPGTAFELCTPSVRRASRERPAVRYSPGGCPRSPG